MIFIEKTSQENQPYELSVGDFQQYGMKFEDLLDLSRCVHETIKQGKDEAPTSRFRILNSQQYSEISTVGRSTLWMGEKKWHISNDEVVLLEKNLDKLTSQSG